MLPNSLLVVQLGNPAYRSTLSALVNFEFHYILGIAFKNTLGIFGLPMRRKFKS